MCVNINFEGEAGGLTEISKALPSSLGAAESDPSGDWRLLALSLGRESSPGQSWEAWRLASEEQSGSPRHRNSYPGPSPRLLEIVPTRLAVAVPGQGSGDSAGSLALLPTQQDHTGGPMGFGSLV